MTISNHMATGAIIGLAIANPLFAVPLAFASHFLLDALPHFGYPGDEGYGELFKNKLAVIVSVCDIIIAILLITLLALYSPTALVFAAVALSPDIMWPIRYFFFERKGKTPPDGPVTRFHVGIQRFERPWGLVVELALLCGLAVLLFILM